MEAVGTMEKASSMGVEEKVSCVASLCRFRITDCGSAVDAVKGSASGSMVHYVCINALALQVAMMMMTITSTSMMEMVMEAMKDFSEQF